MATDLTPEQEARLPEYTDIGVRMGLSTEPADFLTAELAIAQIYLHSKLEVPRFHRVSSPDAARKLLASHNAVTTGERHGCHDAAWAAWALYCRDVLELDIGAEAPPWIDIAQSCGWWWPRAAECVISDRPASYSFDQDKRLHNATGPAIGYRDGWGVYAWHGTVIPRAWIAEPGALTPEIAIHWHNTEQRRCAIEMLGYGPILEALGAKTIDTHPDPEIGVLLEAEMDGERERFLKVQCGTGRTFVLPVPPDVHTALEANAWTYGLEAADLLQLEVRT